MIAEHFGREVSLPYLRDRCHISKVGVSLLGISDGARAIGLRTVGARTSLSMLEGVPTPCIVHWSQNHFVVVVEAGNGRVLIADPAKGLRDLTMDQFRRGCGTLVGEGRDEESVTVLLLEPTEDFAAAGEDSADPGDMAERLTWWRMASRLLEHRRMLLPLGLTVGAGLALNLVAPFLTQAVVDRGIGQKDLGVVYLLLIAQLMVFVGRTTAQFVQSRVVLRIGQRLNISLVSSFLTKMMGLAISFFDRRTVGDVLQRIQDHNRIDQFLTHSLLQSLLSVSSLLVYGAILAYYDVQIFLTFVVAGVLSAIWVGYFLRRRRLLDDRRFVESSESDSSVVQFVTGMVEIKLNGVEETKRAEWEGIQNRRFETNLRRLALDQTQQGGTLAIQQMASILIVFFAATAVIDGAMTLGMMMAVQQVVGQLSQPMSQLLNIMQSFQDASLSLERIDEIYQHEDEEGADPASLPPGPVDLELDRLSFGYEGPSAPRVVEDLSLRLPAGTVTAIVGASGSGKTTLLKLLLTFYPPESGEIRVGGVPLQELSARAWRARCGVVMQDGFLFHDTIAGNIALDPDLVDEARLRRVAELAHIASYVDSLPLGFATKIGRDGQGLSQGQRQRILIARALYKNPQFLFLDEATSALDATSERAVHENMQRFFAGRTVLVIAHRLSTVKRADQIVVLDGGRIVEQGTHAELAARRGAYFELVQNQLELAA